MLNGLKGRLRRLDIGRSRTPRGHERGGARLPPSQAVIRARTVRPQPRPTEMGSFRECGRDTQATRPAFLALLPLADQPCDRSHDAVLDVRASAGHWESINLEGARLIAAFLPEPTRRDVRHDIVGIPGDPRARAELAPQGVHLFRDECLVVHHWVSRQGA